MAQSQTEPRAAHLEQRKRTHTKTRPTGQKQKKSTSLPKPCPNPFRTNRFNAPETWRPVPANKTARVTASRATPRCGTEDKSTFVLIQVFLCAPGILEKNGPVWKNREPRRHAGNQMFWSLFDAMAGMLAKTQVWSVKALQMCYSMMRKEIHGRSRVDQNPGTSETRRNSSRALATSNHHCRRH